MRNIKPLTIITVLLIFLLIFFIAFFTQQVMAAPSLGDAFGEGSSLDQAAGKAYNTGESGSVESIAGDIITAAFSLLGILFIALMIYGGFMWMTDRGNADRVEKAKKIMIAAVIGLIIIIASYALTYFIVSFVSTELY